MEKERAEILSDLNKIKEILTRFPLRNERARKVMARLLCEKEYFRHEIGGLFVESLTGEAAYRELGYQEMVYGDCVRFEDILRHCGTEDTEKIREWQEKLALLQDALFATWMREPAMEYINRYLEWELQELCTAANRRQRDDLETIRILAGHFDLNRQEETDQLYELLLKSRKHFFGSWVGAGFVEYLQTHTSRYRKNKRRSRALRRLAFVCILIALLALVPLGYESARRYKSRVMDEAWNMIRDAGTEAVGETEETEQIKHTEKLEAEKTDNSDDKILRQYEGLYRMNPDLVGWLKMEGLDLSLPVVQNLREEDYYLTHAFNGSPDKRGTLFVDADCLIRPLDGCIVIYGHHMSSGDVFGSLKKYEKEEFWRGHPEFTFDSIYETGHYEIAAVVRTHILKTDEAGFRYYRFHGYGDEQAFGEFVSFIDENKLYETGVELSYGDSFVILSTCEYSSENGRLLVIGKRRKDI